MTNHLCIAGLLLLWMLPLAASAATESSLEDIKRRVNAGQWQRASNEIARLLRDVSLSHAERDALQFQAERMRRIALDFSKNRAETFARAQALLPGLVDATFARWEAAGAVEFLEIDGRRAYFNRTADNLSKVHPEARAMLAQVRPANSNALYRLEHLRAVMAESRRTGNTQNTPATYRVTYRLTVPANTVPDGEIIRAWLPLPRQGGRQSFDGLVTTDPPVHVMTPAASPLSCVYLEKTAGAGQPTVFSAEFEYSSFAFYQSIDADKVVPAAPNRPELAPHLQERPPHIVFSDRLKSLSQTIVGTETNRYRKARLIFEWVAVNIPWAGAREYSTLDSLTDYALERRWGDCGIQTLLFMTLCRMNGIPARWESGWTTEPVENMHDWCRIYLEPYGWLPVDVSYGFTDSKDEAERWFYLGGLDQGRLVVNDDYAQPLYPAKIHWRSEPLDFQRGEVEWRGGNLYFNQWQWQFDVKRVPAGKNPAPLLQKTQTPPIIAR